ncbi:unnamed protein product [Rotaria sp. Silwood1]|nr:unnamed protein product [Rotaria sp. Silwood1]CAF3575458.1 unnamed protein product [Rotaria sp. Silwood1]CAF4849764.1 unnamed protein product [Rotaria sp. Silwood1]CAF4850935.1 unnamed protein product [Rotaria sp. Silwood1]
MFAGFPRALSDVSISVAEILPNNVLTPFPGGEWNTFNPTTSSANPENRFVNVNAVFTDSHDNLWVVDAGVIGNRTIRNSAKLVKINLQTNTVERVYSVSSLNPPEGFALNDVRIGSRHAFLTESGLGSVVIINLENGQVRRVLHTHSSTKFADPTVVRMEGRVVLDEKGQPKRMPNNNLELTPDEKTLFYKASFGYNWFRVSTDDLINETMTEPELGQRVSLSWKTMPTGGTTMDDQGNIYLMDLERQAVWQQNFIDGSWKLIVHDERIIWGDASDISEDGFLYIPMAQNNRIPTFNNVSMKTLFNQLTQQIIIHVMETKISNSYSADEHLNTSIEQQTKIITLNNLTQNQLEQLENYSVNNLQCPCSDISIKYDRFITFQPTYHQICAIVFCSDLWSDNTYWKDTTFYSFYNFQYISSVIF